MIIRKYQTSDEKGWVYCKALSYLFSPFFDDRETEKPELMTDVYDHRVEWVAEVDGQIVGLIDIDIYTEECSQSYIYAPSKRTAYFTNLAVHPDFQGQGIAQALFEKAEQELREQGVEKLAIFTREDDAANHFYPETPARAQSVRSSESYHWIDPIPPPLLSSFSRDHFLSSP